MKILTVTFLIVIFCTLSGCKDDTGIPAELQQQYPESISISVSNPTDLPRNDGTVLIKMSDLKQKHTLFNGKALLFWSGKDEIDGQIIDSNDDGNSDGIVLNLSLRGREEKEVTVRFHPDGEKKREYTKRTQAE